MDDGESSRDPCHDKVVRDEVSVRIEFDIRMGGAGRRRSAEFLMDIPKDRAAISGASEVRGGFVDDGDFETFRFGLFLARDVYMDAIFLSVLIGIEFGLDPKTLANPVGRSVESIDNLGLAIFEDGLCGSSGMGERQDEGGNRSGERHDGLIIGDGDSSGLTFLWVG